MRNRSLAGCIRMSVATGLLLGMTSAAMLHALGPAAAKPVTTATCDKKYRGCVTRCEARYPRTEDVLSCVRRTCNKQQDNCYASLGKGSPGGGKLALPPGPKETIGHGPFSPIGAGILETSPGMPAQGPSATGSPATAPATPSAPPVVIR